MVGTTVIKTYASDQIYRFITESFIATSFLRLVLPAVGSDEQNIPEALPDNHLLGKSYKKKERILFENKK